MRKFSCKPFALGACNIFDGKNTHTSHQRNAENFVLLLQLRVCYDDLLALESVIYIKEIQVGKQTKLIFIKTIIPALNTTSYLI